MTGLLTRVFVLRFYRQHAGLLVLLLLGCFAAVQAVSLVPYHLAIMRALLASWAGLALVMGLWAAWYARALGSALRLLHSEEGRFLHQLRGLPAARQVFLFGIVTLQTAGPVLLYSLLLAGFAWRTGMGAKGAAVLCFQLLSVALSVLLLCRAINRASVPATLRLRLLAARRRPLSFALWPLGQLWRHHRRTYIVVKLFSFFLLYIPFVWNADRYEHDSLPLFLIFLTAANSWSAYGAVRFLEGPLRFHRNLPLRALTIGGVYLLTYTVFLLPEAVYLAWAGRGLVPPLQLAGIWMAPLSALLFLTAVQYGNGTGRDEFAKVLGGLSLVSLFFFTGEYYWRWSAVLWLIGGFLFFYNRRRFEDDTEP